METTFKNLKIKSEFQGGKAAPWNNNSLPTNYNHHVITVTNMDDDTSASFDFWASQMRPEIQSENDLLGALDCFLSDAISGEMDLNEFYREFYYGTDDIEEATKTHKACQKAFENALYVIGDTETIYSMANEIRELV